MQQRIRLIALLFVTVAVTPLLSQRNAGESNSAWPRWRGSHFDGTVSTGRRIFDESFELRIRWTKKLGSGYSGVVVDDSHAVTLFSDGTSDFVVSLAADTGTEEWRVRLGPAFPGKDGSTGGPVSTPAISGDTVFALGPYGDLVALDARSGRQRWKKQLVQELQAITPHWGFTTSPLVVREKVIVLTGAGPGRAVTAFDARTGAIAWQSGTDVASYQSPMVVRGGDAEQIVAGGDQSLFGLDPRDGRELWKYEHRGSGFYAKIINPVLVGSNGLLITYRPDESVLLRLERADEPPVPVWTTRELKLNYGTPVVRGDTIYGYSGGFLTAIDAATGALRWRSRPPGDGFPILVDDHLVVATKQGRLVVSAAVAEGFQPKASIELFSNLLWTPPSFAGGRIFARDSYEAIAAVDVVSSRRMTSPNTNETVAGKIPESDFARSVASIERSSDPAASAKQFLEQQKSFPIIEAERYAHIVFKGDQKEVLLRSDVLGFGREIPMHRIAGTDLHYASLQLKADARVSYQISTALGEWTNDSSNPLKATSENFAGSVSLLLMPRADKRIPERGTPSGKLVPLSFDSGTARAEHLSWGGKREVHVYLPPDYEKDPSRRWPAIYVLYGKQMLEDGHLAAALERQLGSSIEPAIVVFVHSTNPYEYARTFRAAHTEMLTQRLVPWIDGQFRTRPDPGDRLLAGADEAGFAAVEIGIKHPEIFGRIAAQSIFPLSSGDKELLDLIDRAPKRRQKFSVDWGRYDPIRTTDKLDVPGFSSLVKDRLAKRGFEVSGGEWSDGSVVSLWSARLLGALAKLTPLATAQ